MNAAKTGLLLSAMTALFVGVGYVIGGTSGMVFAFLFALATNAFAWWNSDHLALARHKAQPITAMSEPQIYRMVTDLARKADLPVPKVYLIASEQPNAFATGRNPDNAAVALTTGLLRLLSREEIGAVIAHELAHIKNRDTLIMTVAATIGGAISMLAQLGFWLGGRRNRGQFGFVGVLIAMILAPLAASLIQMAISRTREFSADRDGAEICGNPLDLAAALRRIGYGAERHMMPSAEANPASAHLFIVNPLAGTRIDRLFATHPPVEARIKALEDMAYEGTYRRPTRAEIRQRATTIPRVGRR